MNKHKLLVIEGTDGAGKGTQLSLLIEYCKNNSIDHSTFDFPQYYKTFFGEFAGRFLKGEFGDIADVPPYVVSIPYAADRWQAKDEMNAALEQGKLVLLNRYTTSNAAYQSAKLPPNERQTFIEWCFEMEYNQFKIPKEDIVVFLYVPFTISQKLIEQKESREYLGHETKKDIHESNLSFLQEVEKVYLSLSQQYPHWITIDCCKDGKILPKEEIHKKIIYELKQKGFL